MKLLYPIKKKHTASTQYNSHMLIILLETICHLSPPYPNGWPAQPLPADRSLSADIVRLRLLFQEMAGLGIYVYTFCCNNFIAAGIRKPRDISVCDQSI